MQGERNHACAWHRERKRTVIAPQPAGLRVPAQIERGELYIADGELLRGRVQRRLQHGDAVVLQHVQQRRLACVVEAQEQQLGVRVRKA